jgi:hypothetical protein
VGQALSPARHERKHPRHQAFSTIGPFFLKSSHGIEQDQPQLVTGYSMFLANLFATQFVVKQIDKNLPVPPAETAERLGNRFRSFPLLEPQFRAFRTIGDTLDIEAH